MMKAGSFSKSRQPGEEQQPKRSFMFSTKIAGGAALLKFSFYNQRFYLQVIYGQAPDKIIMPQQWFAAAAG